MRFVVKVETEEQFDQLSTMLSRLSEGILESLKDHIQRGLYIFIGPDWSWSWSHISTSSTGKQYQQISIQDMLNLPQTNPELFI